MDLGTPNLRFERRVPIGWCTVDNPAQRNALSMAMYRGLGRAIRGVAGDPRLEALVITGVGDVFIVGGDPAAHGPGDAPPAEEDLPFPALHGGEVPVVAAINGHCQASGLWLAVLADVAVVSERARFRLPELRLGVAAPWSSALLPPVIGLARAKELALTSRPFGAAEAHAMGLVARVVPHDDLHDEAERAAYELLEAGPAARAAWKRAAHAHLPPVDERAVTASIGTAEAREGFAAFAERRPPSWSRVPGRGEDRRSNGRVGDRLDGGADGRRTPA
ncbi:enoyl-CoA hydratase/carnithine racemase [Thermocatellispora tengchongensis]|uniref:Enoyl-CoA hydratase/carnithine racemase n=1 Tax=Thermocatellispora tengchongensis TaxID=1073253 RepID=A0A840PHX9_9ACTN|nr:enoyl-CoA hydratase/isomerase family protein [Thermocatellispora tengchongensis]MBB5138436.1 enoyl-CoA hydratase/carnithine racemase [Thermocatellispora tengchongensis]